MFFISGNGIVNDGLILYFDAGIKGSYSGSGTLWRSLANSNNGTLANGATFNSSNGGSISFDGVDDRVTLQSLAVTTAFTFEAWINTSNNNLTRQYIYTKQRQPPTAPFIATYQQMQGIALQNGGVVPTGTRYIGLSYPSTDNKGTFLYTTGTTFLNNTWYHVAATLNNGSPKIYVNAVEYVLGQYTDPTYSASQVPGLFTPNDCKIGGRFDADANDPFAGKIAILRDYNRALSAAEIKQNFETERNRFGV